MSIMTFSLLSNLLHHPLCMKYNGVRNSLNKVFFKVFAKDTITSAEENDTPYKSPSVLQKKVLNFELKFEMKLWLIDAKNIGVSTNIVVRLSYRRSF